MSRAGSGSRPAVIDVVKLVLALGACLIGTVAARAEAPVVATQSGKVAGTAKANGVEAFLGIRFAAPPVGDLRWRAPQSVTPWSGVSPALTYGKDCIQQPQAAPPGPGFNNPTSEDCLFLNIWRPAGSGDRRLPVMVWIHGGGFIMGAGSYPSYDGARFAKQGVILVTFNYRLGRLGVFAHPALSREQPGQPLANYGLMDQIAALKWVKANVAAFGGDPGNVTIFGESAGAYYVNFLMTSPAARGLFAKAISESAGDITDMRSLAGAEADGEAWARSVGATDAAALRALPVNVVWGSPATTPAPPVLDGTLLTRPTGQMFYNGDIASVPYILGANNQEESLIRWMPGEDQRYLASLGPAGAGLLKLYTDQGLTTDAAMARLWGDALMVAPSRARARATSQVNPRTWLYRYSYVPDAAQGKANGAGHDAEMEMVFKNRDLRWPGPWSAADTAMAETVNGYWVNFAKTGDPNGPGLPLWPAYSGERDVVLDFANGGPIVVTDFNKAKLDAIEAVTKARGDDPK